MNDATSGNHDRRVFEDSATGLKGYRNATGRVVIPATFPSAYEFGAGGVAAVVDGKTPFLYIDVAGRTIAQAYAMDNGPDYFHEGIARIVRNGRVGFMTDRGHVIIPPQFDSASSFCHGIAEVALDGERFDIDTLGARVPTPLPR